ncbi:MAG: VOC family protein [Actinomycetota bacterium]|nr:VOC family protein [Actinomycetota bacterium]
MVGVSTYLNFDGCAEEALLFYRDLFGTDFATPITRMGDMPADPSAPALTDSEKHLVMHAALPILGGHIVMATDVIPSQGHQIRRGNTMTLNLELEDRAETERLFAALSAGGSESFGLMDMPWGAYWGTCADRFGIRWMFNCTDEPGASTSPPPG